MLALDRNNFHHKHFSLKRKYIGPCLQFSFRLLYLSRHSYEKNECSFHLHRQYFCHIFLSNLWYFGGDFTEEVYKFFRCSTSGMLKSYSMFNLTTFCNNVRLRCWFFYNLTTFCDNNRLKSSLFYSSTTFRDDDRPRKWVVSASRNFFQPTLYNIRIGGGPYSFGIVGFSPSIFRSLKVVRNIFLVISKLLDMVFFLAQRFNYAK